MRRSVALMISAGFSLAGAQRLAALEFVFSYSPDTSQNVIDGFTAAGNRWAAALADPIQVNVNISFEVLGQDVLGETITYRKSTLYNQTSGPFQNVRAALVGDAKSTDDNPATLSLPDVQNLKFLMNFTGTQGITYYLDDNGSTNNRQMQVANANLKAIGLIPMGSTDGSIKFSSAFTFDYNPLDGVTSGAYDFVGLATHELGHVLGFSSGVDQLDQSPNNGEGFYLQNSVLDLFRYSAESFTQSGGAVTDRTADPRNKYFSIDGGVTAIANFATGKNYGDTEYNGLRFQASHWKAGQNLGIMNPYLTSGTFLTPSENDLRAMDVIGYDRRFTWAEWPGSTWGTVPVPAAPTTVRFDGDAGGNPVNPQVNLLGPATAASLGVGNDNVNLNLGGNNFSIAGAIQVGDVAGKTGTLNITGVGQLSVGAIYVGGTSAGAAGTGSLTIQSPATLLLYPGSTVRVYPGGSLSAASILSEGQFSVDSGHLTISGVFTNKGTAVLDGIMAWGSGSQLKNQGGNLTLNADTGSVATSGPRLVVSSGQVTLNHGQHLSGLDLSGGKVTVASASPLVLRDLVLTGSGIMDMGSSELIWWYSGSSPLSTLNAAISGGRLMTSFAMPPYPVALAPLDNAQLHLASWAGEPLSGYNQLLMEYAYVGDVNLDGLVTDADLLGVYANMNGPGGWLQGDMNYDGLVNLVDLTMVTGNMGAGSGANGVALPSLAALSMADWGSDMAVMVPEPGALALLAGALCMLGRRRRGNAAGSRL